MSRELVEAKLQLVLVDFAVESWQPASQVLNEITLRLTDDSSYRRGMKCRDSGIIRTHAVRLYVWSYRPSVSLGARFSRSWIA